MFQVLFLTIFGIFLIMSPGAILSRRGIITTGGIKELSKVLIYVVYPCLIFSSITRSFTLEGLFSAWVLPASSMVIMVTGYFLALAVSLAVNFSNTNQRHAFLYQNTMNNYSFLPMAIAAEIFSQEAVAAVIFSTLGAEITVWTLGVFILTGHKFEKRSLLHLLSPPLLAMYGALIWLAVFEGAGLEASLYLENTSVLYYFHNAAEVVGQATIPLALLVAGARLAMLRIDKIGNKYTWIISGMRLLITPLAATGVLLLMPLTDEQRAVMLVVAVMPVSLTSSVLNEIYKTDDGIINSTVLLTHLLGLLTIPIMLTLLL